MQLHNISHTISNSTSPIGACNSFNHGQYIAHRSIHYCTDLVCTVLELTELWEPFRIKAQTMEISCQAGLLIFKIEPGGNFECQASPPSMGTSLSHICFPISTSDPQEIFTGNNSSSSAQSNFYIKQCCKKVEHRIFMQNHSETFPCSTCFTP